MPIKWRLSLLGFIFLPCLIWAQVLDLDREAMGKCFAMIQLEKEVAKELNRGIEYEDRMLVVSPPQWEESFDTLLLHLPKGIEGEQLTTFRHPLSSSASFWVLKGADRNCVSADTSKVVYLCGVEIPANYKTINERFVENVEAKDTLILPIKKMIVPAKMEFVPLDNQIPFPSVGRVYQPQNTQGKYYIKLEEGNWTDWKEFLCITCNFGYTRNTIQRIQKALTEKGYSTPIDNIMSAHLKATLTKFQKDHGLPVGNLNLETLQALGL